MKTREKVNLAFLPTPIEALNNLQKTLAGPKLLCKRDDQTGLAFGGNKTRKLEYLIADALAQGADTLITAGAIQSNHCRQTAAAAAKSGLKCVLVLVGEEPERYEANTFLDDLFNAEKIWTTWENRDSALEDCFNQLSDKSKPYLIPYGGSNPIGASSYFFAMQELKEQGYEPDWIVFPSSSGGTQAGMVLGAKHFGIKSRILGISVDKPELEYKPDIVLLANQTAEYLEIDTRIDSDDVLLNGDFSAPGYAVMTGGEKDAIRLFANTEGLLLDPVYTGRAAYGLITLIKKGFFKSDETVLFWHTGGTPALFETLYLEDLQSK